ncbi:MAG: YegP family protein [Chloroflexi bacterium]|nr:YegP family protein [Chloroflexota bacterium]
MVTNPKFQLFQGNNQEYYFRLNARNGEQILASEGYQTLANCMNGIESVKKNAADGRRFERKVAKDGRFYFNLTATNGQVIGKSQMYKSEDGRDNGIQAVQNVAADAPIEDLTAQTE